MHSVWLTLNRNCNLSCHWCYAKNYDALDNQEMSLEIAKQLIDISIDLGVKDFKIIGGEPTLHHNFEEIIKYIMPHGAKVVIVTNGVILQNDKFCQAMKQLNYNKLHFGISLKGSSDQEYEQDCGASSFSAVLCGISNCRKYSLDYSLSYVLTQDNIDKIECFAKAIKDCGIIDPIFFSFCNDAISTDDLNSGAQVVPLKMDSILAQHYNGVCEILEDKIFLHQSLPLCLCNPIMLKKMIDKHQIATSCHVHRRSGVIFDTDGSILLCNHLVGYSIGKLGEDYWDKNSFESFWNSEYLESLHKKLTTMPSEKCIECSEYIKCGGGCCIQWFSHGFSDYNKYYQQAKDELKREVVL